MLYIMIAQELILEVVWASFTKTWRADIPSTVHNTTNCIATSFPTQIKPDIGLHVCSE